MGQAAANSGDEANAPFITVDWGTTNRRASFVAGIRRIRNHMS